jgi:hypothetical protein
MDLGFHSIPILQPVNGDIQNERILRAKARRRKNALTFRKAD